MKLGRFENHRIGVISENRVFDVTDVLQDMPEFRWPLPPGDQFVSRLDVMEKLISEKIKRADSRPIDSVQFDSPIANPTKIIAAPINYKEHIKEAREDPEIRQNRKITSIGDWGLFLKSTTSVIGCSEEIQIRFPERRTDHEIELAVVIGKHADRVSSDVALSHVAGYCIGLDMTLRGPELPSWRKSIASYTVLGPWLVTTSEIPSPGNLEFSLKVNGEIRQKSCTSELVYSIPRLIEYASAMYPLFPGDVILTGTPDGVGPVAAGDEIEAEFENIGSMKVRVASLVQKD